MSDNQSDGTIWDPNDPKSLIVDQKGRLVGIAGKPLSLSDQIDKMLPEDFRLTTGLRFKAGRLQQLWQGSGGTQKWEDVPSVDGDGK